MIMNVYRSHFPKNIILSIKLVEAKSKEMIHILMWSLCIVPVWCCCLFYLMANAH